MITSFFPSLQVTSALSYLHSPRQVGIVHRDLKCSNILVFRFPDIGHPCFIAGEPGDCRVLVKVTDMGICANPLATKNKAIGGLRLLVPECMIADSYRLTEKVCNTKYITVYIIHRGMYVCMYVCVCVLCVCVYVCMYVCVVCMYVCVYVCMYVCMCVLFVCMCVCMYVCMCVFMYVSEFCQGILRGGHKKKNAALAQQKFTLWPCPGRTDLALNN